jgi:GNAT superfamily N-acetyltransferase
MVPGTPLGVVTRVEDAPLIAAWLAARAVARGLPQPVAEYGGYRVETNSEVEARRWVFAEPTAGLTMLANTIREPRHFIKLCGTDEVLREILPGHWRLQPRAYFMAGSEPMAPSEPKPGYQLRISRRGAITEARIRTTDGILAASGYAAETMNAFVYDRIVVTPQHRRLGLGSAIMAALSHAKTRPGTPGLLVATEEGRELYARLGWQVLSPYASASIPER